MRRRQLLIAKLDRTRREVSARPEHLIEILFSRLKTVSSYRRRDEEVGFILAGLIIENWNGLEAAPLGSETKADPASAEFEIVLEENTGAPDKE